MTPLTFEHLPQLPQDVVGLPLRNRTEVIIGNN